MKIHREMGGEIEEGALSYLCPGGARHSTSISKQKNVFFKKKDEIRRQQAVVSNVVGEFRA